ncbi:MAG: 2-amino-4-hydroxy-6-hydroxymethyldihydropteridine diphosphokinase [Desulfobacteraceae bacterium]|nr:2-amino-4-hydroxy-6-hydroxymethyldihydropteridine diphosphokinase [Desulfobacteraceae bacterium]
MNQAPDEKKHIAYIAVGANLGDRVAACRQGAEMLSKNPDLRIFVHSPYYETAPLGYDDQPWFVNAVFGVETGLEPEQLLGRLKEAENRAGRDRSTIRFGPRVLDLDLIFYENEIIHSPDLVVPHPRMHQRAFVLRPLADIAPELIHPKLGRSVRDLLSDPVIADQGCERLNPES